MQISGEGYRALSRAYADLSAAIGAMLVAQPRHMTAAAERLEEAQEAMQKAWNAAPFSSTGETP